MIQTTLLAVEQLLTLVIDTKLSVTSQDGRDEICHDIQI